ncbi:MAG: NosD domain-containing protein, partial [Candidatus Hodarchaeota archaeon]
NEVGIHLRSDSNWNNIILNCFNNTINAVDSGSQNQWDNGIKGNHWSDYTGSDGGGDGIGDVPYNITGSAGSQDHFPLMICPLPPEKPPPLELTILISVIFLGPILLFIALIIRNFFSD